MAAPLAGDSLQSRLGALIQARLEELAREDGPGLVVGVSLADGSVLRRARGLARLAPAQPLAPGAPMLLASISKQFTAACAVALDLAGTLSLDAPIGAVAPELAPALRRPTVRQLLEQRSGLRCVYELETLTGVAAPRPRDFVWAALLDSESVQAEPGAWQVYGNTGYDLVALAIERVTGLAFEEALRRTILAPLRLESVSGYGARADIAEPYSRVFGDLRPASSMMTGLRGSGGLAASLDDVLAWTAALRSEDARLDPRIWRALKTAPTLADGRPGGYALGLTISRRRGIDLIGHGGSLFGVATMQLSAPAHGVDVVVLANLEAPAEALAREIMECAVADRLEPAPSPAPAGALAGALFTDETLAIGFAARDGRLTMSFQGVDGLPLRRNGEGCAFDGATGIIGVRPHGPDEIEVRAGGERRLLRRAAPAPAAPPPEVFGTYASEERRLLIRLTPEGARLEGAYDATEAQAQLIAPDLFQVRNATTSFLLRILRDRGEAPIAAQIETTRTRAFTLRRVPETSLTEGTSS